jgi:hypothetical protein
MSRLRSIRPEVSARPPMPQRILCTKYGTKVEGGEWRGYQQVNGDWLQHNDSRTHGKRHLRKFCHGRPSRAVSAHVIVVISGSNNKTEGGECLVL